MITFRPDTSFPFLKVARETGVPYAKVLRIVQVAESHKTTLLAPADVEITRRVLVAMKAEADRRRAVDNRNEAENADR